MAFLDLALGTIWKQKIRGGLGVGLVLLLQRGGLNMKVFLNAEPVMGGI